MFCAAIVTSTYLASSFPLKSPAWRQLPLHSTQHFGHAALGDLLHHFTHLQMLFEQAIDVLHLGTATRRNTAFARTLDNGGKAALLGCH